MPLFQLTPKGEEDQDDGEESGHFWTLSRRIQGSPTTQLVKASILGRQPAGRLKKITGFRFLLYYLGRCIGVKRRR
jgi:hypothetical protein